MNYKLPFGDTQAGRTANACAILAGGKNRRMGKNKAFIEIDGIPLIKKNIALLSRLFTDMIIVTNSPKDFASLKNEAAIISDKIKNVGPLGGILSALSYTERESVFFIACDMPFLHNDMIIHQLSYFKNHAGDALIPKIGKFIEPLHAIYKKRINNILNHYIHNNTVYAIRNFLKLVNVKYMPIENTPFNRKIFTNINTPNDYKNVVK